MARVPHCSTSHSAVASTFHGAVRASIRNPWLAVLASLSLGLGCPQPSGDDKEDTSSTVADSGHEEWDATIPADAGVTDGATPPDAGTPDAAGSCATNAVNMIVRPYDDTERYYVEVLYQEERAALQLDTGSGLTFLYTGTGSTPYVPDYGTITVGCEDVTVAGRAYDRTDSINGLDVIGLMGMEYLTQRPALLDVKERLLVRFNVFPTHLTTTPGAFSVHYDDVFRLALVPCTLDDQEVRLMFDTGGGHTLWVGQQGKPGDKVVEVVDFEGHVFPIYVGTASLTFPGQTPRTIVVARAPQFPYFQQTIDAVGGNLHGLLGVTSFPEEQLLVDGASSVMWAIPRPVP